MSNILEFNRAIIAQEAFLKGFNYNGDNLDTYEGWETKGYAVKLGQKAFIKTHLWTKGKNRRKILEYLFTDKQVVKVNIDQLVVI
jgi:GH15 family glucan-1,4-alpha-glucosidase